jgi:hypothetical protein
VWVKHSKLFSAVLAGEQKPVEARLNPKSEGRNPKERTLPLSVLLAKISVDQRFDRIVMAFQPSDFSFLLAFGLQSSLNAAAIGSRAARIAGNSPPINPINAAQTMPRMSSCGVT